MRLDEIQRLGNKHFSGTLKDLNSLTNKKYADYTQLGDGFAYFIFPNKLQIIDSENEEIVAVFTFEEFNKIPKCVRERKIIVSKKYRGKGLGQLVYQILLNNRIKIVSDDQHTTGTRVLWNKFVNKFKVEGIIDIENLKLYEFEKILKSTDNRKSFSSELKRLDIDENDLVRNNLQVIKPFLKQADAKIKSEMIYFSVQPGEAEVENEIFNVYSQFSLDTFLLLS